MATNAIEKLRSLKNAGNKIRGGISPCLLRSRFLKWLSTLGRIGHYPHLELWSHVVYYTGTILFHMVVGSYRADAWMRRGAQGCKSLMCMYKCETENTRKIGVGSMVRKLLKIFGESVVDELCPKNLHPNKANRRDYGTVYMVHTLSCASSQVIARFLLNFWKLLLHSHQRRICPYATPESVPKHYWIT